MTSTTWSSKSRKKEVRHALAQALARVSVRAPVAAGDQDRTQFRYQQECGQAVHYWRECWYFGPADA
jgi:hypothetical protein